MEIPRLSDSTNRNKHDYNILSQSTRRAVSLSVRTQLRLRGDSAMEGIIQLLSVAVIHTATTTWVRKIIKVTHSSATFLPAIVLTMPYQLDN